MKLIDKDKIVAEIKKLKGKVWDGSSYCTGWQHALRMLEIELNSLEVKEVSYDEALERARKEYKNHEAFNGFREMLVRIFPELRKNDNENDLEKEIIRVSKNEYFDFTDWKSIARHFYELGLKIQKKE